MTCQGCTTCATKEKKTPAGCGNNGNCLTGGCGKLSTYDWLSDMELPANTFFEVVEVKFKGGRKSFYRNINFLRLKTNDFVSVNVGNGFDVGTVSLQGETARLQMIKKGADKTDELPIILRFASDFDLARLKEAKEREYPTLRRTREIIKTLDLKMKLSDVEFQADNTKAIFYYSADDRVDFRELIKMLAAEFRTRIQMKQINLRQEAGRLGGIGSCGRELCCSTWLTNHKTVSSSAARYQSLSFNPVKLSGQCGRLKCCLNYELETYLDALIDIPEVKKPIKTKKGEAKLEKVDIFRKILWFSFEVENIWHPLTAKRVSEIIALNKKGIYPESLTDENAILEIGEPEENTELSFDTGKFTALEERSIKKKDRRKRRPRSRTNPRPQARNHEKKNRQENTHTQHKKTTQHKNYPRKKRS